MSYKVIVDNGCFGRNCNKSLNYVRINYTKSTYFAICLHSIQLTYFKSAGVSVFESAFKCKQ